MLKNSKRNEKFFIHKFKQEKVRRARTWFCVGEVAQAICNGHGILTSNLAGRSFALSSSGRFMNGMTTVTLKFRRDLQE